MAPTSTLLNEFRDMLSAKHTVKYLVPPTDYLRWTTTRTDTGPIHAAQPTLIAKSLALASLSEANACNPPLPMNPDLAPYPPALPLTEIETLTCKYILGHLRYLADCTRPDITFSTALVFELARYMSAPTTTHMQLLRHTLRYLNGTAQHGTRFRTSVPIERITTYSDGDYGESPDRKSTSGAQHTTCTTL